MTPVFFNSAQIDTPEWLILRGGTRRKRQLAVRYGVFQHPVAGPTLIDTGYTTHAVSAPGRSAILRFYGAVLAPRLIEDAQPEQALARLGLETRDIRTVIVTHFHADHISGLALFPEAKIITSATAGRRIKETSNLKNIRHGVFPELIPPDLDTRLKDVESFTKVAAPLFPNARDLFGDGSVLAVALPGHADGHFGLLFPKLDPPLLYAVDAQWLFDALPSGKRPGLPSRWIADDAGSVGPTTDLLDAFRSAGGQVVLCHDDGSSPFDATPGRP